MESKFVPAVLLYATAEHPLHGPAVLMVHRNKKPNDAHQGKWNGLGGKLEPGEDPLQATVREFLEESGIQTQQQDWKWAGQLVFPKFKVNASQTPGQISSQKTEDWWVNVFTVHFSKETAQQAIQTAKNFSSPEGSLEWVPLAKVMSLNLWPGDLEFLPLVLSAKPFFGIFYYSNGELSRFQLQQV